VSLVGGDTFLDRKGLAGSGGPPTSAELAGPLPDTLQNQEKESIEVPEGKARGKVRRPTGGAGSENREVTRRRGHENKAAGVKKEKTGYPQVV